MSTTPPLPADTPKPSDPTSDDSMSDAGSVHSLDYDMPNEEEIATWDAAKQVRLFPNFSDQVQILVGPSEQPFLVHKDRICERSRFFRTALAPDRWLEGQQNVVRLPETKPDHFRVYVHWLYASKLDLRIRYRVDKVVDPCEQEGLMEQYVLGEYLDDRRLRRRALVGLIDGWARWTAVPTPYITGPWYLKTAAGSVLRTYLVEVTLHYHWEKIGEFDDDMSREFVMECLVASYDAPPPRSRRQLMDRLREKVFSGSV